MAPAGTEAVTRQPGRVVMTYEEAVAAGVSWLDQEVPNWRQLIDVGSLSLYSPYLCVLGQLAGGQSWAVETNEYSAWPYHNALIHVLPTGTWEERKAWAVAHGFAVAASFMDVTPLRDLWVKEINKSTVV